MRYHWLLLGFVGLTVLDRLTKLWAQAGRTGQVGWFKFQLFKNDALVFSWPVENRFAIALMVVAMGVLVYVGWRWWRRGQIVQATGAAVMLVGAMSNLADRLLYGYVIDWAYVGRWWPVGNLADLLVAVGLVIMLWPRPLTTRSS